MKGSFLASPRQVNAFNLLLAATIACLSMALFLQQQTTVGKMAAAKPDDTGVPTEVARRVVDDIVPVGLDLQTEASARGCPDGPQNLFSCKPAIRLVESGDAFLLSLSLRNLATNTVELQLQGSLLSVLTSHRQRDNSIVRRQNSIMLPAAVVTNPAPTYFLTNDLLQIRICKRSSMH